jgi:hypothetical protein
MVESEENLNAKPGIFGYFLLDIVFVYFSGMGFWTVFFWLFCSDKSILDKDIVQNANFLMLPVVSGWALVYLIHKAFWFGTARNRKIKN